MKYSENIEQKSMRTFTAIVLLLLIIFVNNPLLSRARCPLSITNSSGKTVELQVEVADEPSERNRGLMFRQGLDENCGMLFVFPTEKHLNFWMKNTYIPLSIAYVDRKGTITQILDMAPLDTSVTYPSSKPAMYAIEVARGWFAARGITAGCRVVLNGCIGK